MAYVQGHVALAPVKEGTMARYMYQVSYTAESWAAQVKKPEDRIEALKPAVRRLGGRIESAYYTFGDYDIILIANMPDNGSAAAMSIAASAGGALKSIRTTPLMTIREGMAAMRKAKKASYVAPGA